MIIDKPKPSHLASMKALWREAFGDEDSFIDLFFSTAYSPDRAFVAEENGEVASSLYYFDCECRGDKVAYIYGVATALKYRGHGICSLLMEHAHRHLKNMGYTAVLLRPAGDALFHFYRKMGYDICGYVREIVVEASREAVPVKRITAEEYFDLRSRLLPENGVLQEGVVKHFLTGFMDTYAFDGGVLILREEKGEVFCAEILPEDESFSIDEIFGGIVKTLGCDRGRARTYCGDVPFVMGLSLSGDKTGDVYLGLVLD